MYIGGEYTSMTARTINVTNYDEAKATVTLTDAFQNTITSIEDGTPFILTVTNIDTGYAIVIQLKCMRTSDDYELFRFGNFTAEIGVSVPNTYSFPILLTQYVDCTWGLSVLRGPPI